METFQQITANTPLFLLVLGRVGGIFFAAPMFSSRNVPAQIKIALSIIVAIILFLVKKHPPIIVPDHLWAYVFLFAGEVMVGVIIGFVMNFIFAAVQLGGQVIDMQLGYSIVNVIDPLSGTSVPLVGTFKNALALLMFLATNSHYFVFYGLFQSYDLIPLTAFTLPGPFYEKMFMISSGMFTTALKLSIPVIGAVFIVEMALGFIARTVPQMNVFIVGIPAKIFVGIFIMVAALPAYMIMLSKLFDTNYRDILELLRLMGR